MTPVNYLDLGPLLMLIAFGVLSPYVSALATRAPVQLTGIITTLITAVGGFLAQWVNQDHGYDWKRGLYNALFAWLVAAGVHSKWLKNTPTEADLHSKGLQLGGRKRRRLPAGDAGAIENALAYALVFVIAVVVVAVVVKSAWVLIALILLFALLF